MLIQRLNEVETELQCEELELRRLANSLKVLLDRLDEAKDPTKHKSLKQIEHLIFRRKRIEEQIQQECVDKDKIMEDMHYAFKDKVKMIEAKAKESKKKAL